MMDSPGSTFLKYTSDNELRGCVYLKKQENNKLYLGLLSVSPTAQAQGIGKKLLAGAETHARQINCNIITMNVVSLRHELIDWYIRHGYQRTGETKPFPPDNKFGTPQEPLEFVVLEKIVKSE